jgi:hypothetical protein
MSIARVNGVDLYHEGAGVRPSRRAAGTVVSTGSRCAWRRAGLRPVIPGKAPALPA